MKIILILNFILLFLIFIICCLKKNKINNEIKEENKNLLNINEQLLQQKKEIENKISFSEGKLISIEII